MLPPARCSKNVVQPIANSKTKCSEKTEVYIHYSCTVQTVDSNTKVVDSSVVHNVIPCDTLINLHTKVFKSVVGPKILMSTAIKSIFGAH